MPSFNRVRSEVTSQQSADKSSPSTIAEVQATTEISPETQAKIKALKEEIGYRVSAENPVEQATDSIESELEASEKKNRFRHHSGNLKDELELSSTFEHLSPGDQFAEIAKKLNLAKTHHARKDERSQNQINAAKTEQPFDPYNAITIAGGNCHVDEDYLQANLNWKPNVDYELSNDWQPTKIKPFDQSNRLSFDIETLGTTPLEPGCRFIMAGFIIEGPFQHLEPEIKVALEAGFDLILKANTDDAERDLLTQTFKLIDIIGCDIISAHYGIGFDFSFLYDRARFLGVPCPIDIDRSRERYVTSGTDYKGEAPGYFRTYFTHRNAKGYFYNDGSFPQILDTLIAATIDNKVRSNYKSFSLKRLITDHFKIREEKRVELGYQQILSNWDKWINHGDESAIAILKEYLLEDLRDQRDLTNIYGPLIWSQQAFFPIAFQDLLVASPALKWNKLLQEFYTRYNGKLLPNPISYIDPDREVREKGVTPGEKLRYVAPEHGSDTYKYLGGKVDATPCIKSNFFKIDVSSLYPSLMLRYALYDEEKDPLGVMLKALATARKFRYVLKPLGAGDKEAAKLQSAYKESPATFASYLEASKISCKGADGSMKVVINGCYGFVGVGGYNFNSPKTAALVTAYGRIIMKEMMARAFTLSTMVNLDTDGITASPKAADNAEVVEFFAANPDIVYHDKKGNEIPRFTNISGSNCVNAEWIYRYTQAGLPEDIIIDLETNYPKGVIISYKAKNYAYYYHSHTFIPALSKAVGKFGKTTYSTADGISFSPYTIADYIEKKGWTIKDAKNVLAEVTSKMDEIADADGELISPIVLTPTSESNDGYDSTNPNDYSINPVYIIADAELDLPEWMFLSWDWVYNKKSKNYDVITINYELDREPDSPEVLEWMYPKSFDEVEPDEAIGMFTKRNFSKFKKGFLVEYARRIGFFGEECATTYHDHINQKLKAVSSKPYQQLTQEDLEWLTIKRKISSNEKAIVNMGVGNQGDIATYYFGDYIELSKSTGKPMKGGKKQPFYVRVLRGEWDELQADPPELDFIDQEFTSQGNELNFNVSYDVYASELLELKDNINKIAFGRLTTGEREENERKAITLKKASAKNNKRIAAIKRSDKPYAALLDLVKSGGQCGADRAGLDAAIAVGFKTGGEAPKGYVTMTSDGHPGSDLSLKDLGLKENRSEKFGPRTRVNAQKSDATIWFGTTDSPGYGKTFEYIMQYDKPHIVNPTVDELTAFIFDNWIEVLNVAGNRISRGEALALSEGVKSGNTVYEIAYNTCLEAFRNVKSRANDSLDDNNIGKLKGNEKVEDTVAPMVFGI